MNVPNLLSLIRLLLVPVFVAVFFSGDSNAGYFAAAIFLIAFMTDVADAYEGGGGGLSDDPRRYPTVDYIGAACERSCYPFRRCGDA